MARNFLQLSAVLLLQRMLNLSASYTAFADHALYTAKHNGRGRFVYLPRYQEPAGNRFILINVRILVQVNIPVI